MVPPSQYKTGKTLGSGTYAVVKEAVHTKTGKFYACKVISKKLMEGREYMVNMRSRLGYLRRRTEFLSDVGSQRNRGVEESLSRACKYSYALRLF